MRIRIIVLGILLASPAAARAVSLPEAVSITGATTGKVLAEATVTLPSLTGPQKTALVAFITSLGASWPGQGGDILSVSVYRQPNNPGVIGATINGLIRHNDAATAVTQLSSGATSGIIGIVP